MSEYKTLYRKYRPRSFDQVVGQEHVIQTLKNILTNRKVGHAYLFSGPKGTGKTSIAKIFATVLSCLHSNEPTKACDFCLSNVESNLDIIEMDAASNNGVDEIRLLKEKVEQAPINGKFKIYIIDEVHMLSKSAFNALLKTLEEPPKHSVFILATTDPQKIPLTILSRVQRYNFKRISDAHIISHLKEVLDNENILYDEEALKTIALLSTGGMRDALSIADQAGSFYDNKISQESLETNFGLVSIANYIKLLNSIASGNVSEIINLTNSFNESGADASRLINGLININKEWLLFQKTKEKNFLNWLTYEEFLQVKLTQKSSLIIYNELYEISSKVSRHEMPFEFLQIGLISIVEKLDNSNIFSSNEVQQPIPKQNIVQEPIFRQPKPQITTTKPIEVKPVLEPQNPEESDDFFANAKNDPYLKNVLPQEPQVKFENSTPEEVFKHAREVTQSTQEFIFEANEIAGERVDLTAEIETQNEYNYNNEVLDTREFQIFSDQSQPISTSEEYLYKALNVLRYQKENINEKDFFKKYRTLKASVELIDHDEFPREREMFKSAKIIGATEHAIVLLVTENEKLKKLREIANEANFQSYIDYIFNNGYKHLYFLSEKDKNEIEAKYVAFLKTNNSEALPKAYKPMPLETVSRNKSTNEMYNELLKIIDEK
ncbi:DNA polymerase III subunit gamma/tau [Mycoplasmopsis edwardii]|nr:DNA polymerase III subunit gamma/tau [Mycoplasmopsis edwardii]